MARTTSGHVLLVLISAYQHSVRSLVGRTCRFHPSCSVYASDAISRHGACRGTVLAAQRISRCHPWNPGGFDPVPPFRS